MVRGAHRRSVLVRSEMCRHEHASTHQRVEEDDVPRPLEALIAQRGEITVDDGISLPGRRRLAHKGRHAGCELREKQDRGQGLHPQA